MPSSTRLPSPPPDQIYVYQIFWGFSEFVGPQSFCSFDFLRPTYIMEPGFRLVFFNPKYLLFGDLMEKASLAQLFLLHSHTYMDIET